MYKRQDDRYRAEFAAKYLPALFPGVSEMLERLAVQGIPMGIATLNTLRKALFALRIDKLGA